MEPPATMVFLGLPYFLMNDGFLDGPASGGIAGLCDGEALVEHDLRHGVELRRSGVVGVAMAKQQQRAVPVLGHVDAVGGAVDGTFLDSGGGEGAKRRQGEAGNKWESHPLDDTRARLS
jgi:hypothetical protein